MRRIEHWLPPILELFVFADYRFFFVETANQDFHVQSSNSLLNMHSPHLPMKSVDAEHLKSSSTCAGPCTLGQLPTRSADRACCQNAPGRSILRQLWAEKRWGTHQIAQTIFQKVHGPASSQKCTCLVMYVQLAGPRMHSCMRNGMYL